MPAIGRLLSALGLASAPLFAQSPPTAPPVAAVEPVVDEYFGTRITDDYRWMEDRAAPRFVAWAKEENAYARAVLARIPGREALQGRISAHTAGGTAIGGLRLAGGKIFYGKRGPGENSIKLYVRAGQAGKERLLFDPERLSRGGGPHFALDYYAVSPDGGRLAYGTSPGGSEESVLHILDVASGRESSETIDRTQAGAPSWLPDGKAFFYTRFAKLTAGAPETDKYLNSRAYLHRVGSDPETDTPLAGTGVAGSPPLTPVDTPFLMAAPGSPFAFLAVSHGAEPAMTLYVARLDRALHPGADWRRVADTPDAVTDFAALGRRLFLLTHRDAPRYKVVELDAAAPSFATAKLVVPPGARVVEEMRISAGALYVRDLDAGLGRIRRFDLKSGKLAGVPLPGDGAISNLTTDPLASGLIFGLQGWVAPPKLYRARNGKVTEIALGPAWGENLSGYAAEEVSATAPDGTAIPLSIVYKKGLQRDGSHPVWLTGYGAYGIAREPALATRFLTLLDDGGVYAVAHVRGGGELGEEWHQAGRLATKPNTYRDLIACAEYLVQKGYGRAATLAIEGASAGGITVGMAMTERPELFRVVFSSVGDSNPLRSEFGTDGPANSLEYGSVATEAGFKALLAVDAYQHVKPGVAYPAVLLITGMNDPRVAPWQPGKMTARLQAATGSGRPVLLRVDFDAGHGIGSTKAQRDAETADQLAFFYWQIGKPEYQPAP
jgi:prolyl oligopeptidase